jgi:hypothetical protein
MFYSFSSFVEETLLRFGLNETENILSEWNTALKGIDPEEYGNAKGAAFTACVLIFLQDAGCDMAYRYRGTQGFDGLHGLGLFEVSGKYKKPAYAFKAMRILLESPIRVLTNKMDYKEGFAFIAGVSEDNKNITLLISNYESEYQKYDLTIENLPWDSKFTYVRYVVDDTYNLQIAEIENLKGSSFSTSEEMPKHTVHLIRLTTTKKIPLSLNITKPRRGYLYLFDKEITPTFLDNTVIIGKISVKTEVYEIKEVEKVEFYVDNRLKFIDYDMPYQWLWDEKVFGRHEIKAIVYDKGENMAHDDMEVLIFNV